jgi:hypothetical protein
MDAPLHSFLRGYIDAFIKGCPMPLSWYQHGMELHGERARGDWLLHWNGQDSQKFQVHVRNRTTSHWRFDLLGFIRTLGLGNQQPLYDRPCCESISLSFLAPGSVGDVLDEWIPPFLDLHSL